MNYSADVRVTAPVQATEREERVVEAIEALFPETEVTVEDGRVVARGHSVERFADRLREQRILDTARSHLREQIRTEGLAFEVKKQAAREGVVNFVVGSPSELGDIHVDVAVEEPTVEEFVDYLAPRTDADGKPVEDPRSG
jgi:predicted RNA binding protein with dsRBD fold (UPF0201 family)